MRRGRPLCVAATLAFALTLTACTDTTPAGTEAGSSPVREASTHEGLSAGGDSGSLPAPPQKEPTAGPSAPSAGSSPTGASDAGRPTAPVDSLPGKHFSFTDPSSPWVMVNKLTPLKPLDYAPADLRVPNVMLGTSGELAHLGSETATAAEQMFNAAAQDGVTLVLASGYRSYNTQVNLYSGYAASKGQAEADKVSARPGFSEHQSGWAFDIADGNGQCSFLPCFASQPAAIWAAANAYKFGFIVRYQLNQHEVTGYLAESWHLRYIGVAAATDMHNKGILDLEQYFGFPNAPDYAN